ncbi:hypothetical protein Efla_006926 [Eimeria flavescens]
MLRVILARPVQYHAKYWRMLLQEAFSCSQRIHAVPTEVKKRRALQHKRPLLLSPSRQMTFLVAQTLDLTAAVVFTRCNWMLFAVQTRRHLSNIVPVCDADSVALPQEGTCFPKLCKKLLKGGKKGPQESAGAAGAALSHRKEILCLDGMELVFKPTDCVALMGSSGAGKSTLLNCLSNRVSSGVGGEITLNGMHSTRELSKELCSFIQQEDLIFGYLTVEEHLYYQARLRLPRGTGVEEARSTTRCLLESFGLSHIARSFIGGPHEGARGSISGGEKKRLCVATELLSNPSVIFADEPTSGLDSFMAKAVCDQLSLLAAAGCTVVCTIHQPSSFCFALFNKVLLLGEGRVLYYGDRLAAVSWIEHLGCRRCEVDANPAEYILKATALHHLDATAKTERLKEWSERWKREGKEFLSHWERQGKAIFRQRSGNFSGMVEPVVGCLTRQGFPRQQVDSLHQDAKSDAQAKDPLVAASTFEASQRVISTLTSIGAAREARKGERISPFMEAVVLTQRALLLRWRDPSTSYVRLASTLITALIPSFIYFQLGWSLSDAWNRVSACYQVILTQALASLFAVANLFPQARPVAQREFESGVIRMWVFFIGVSTSDTALFIVFPIIFHTITFCTMGLAATASKFFASLCVLLLGVLALQSYGYFISAVLRDEVVALAVTQVTQVILSLFSGFMTQIDQLSIFWKIIAAISPFKYALAAFSLTILENEYFTGEGGQLVSGDSFLQATFGIRRDTFYTNLGHVSSPYASWSSRPGEREKMPDVANSNGWRVCGEVTTIKLTVFGYFNTETWAASPRRRTLAHEMLADEAFSPPLATRGARRCPS